MKDQVLSQLKKLKGPIGILVIGVALASLLVLTKSKPDKAPPQERTWPIEAQDISPDAANPEILLHGRVESRQHTTLRGAVTAYVESTPALEGEMVSKDELLIGLNPIDAQLILAQSEAEVASAEAELLVEKNRNLADIASLELESELVELVSKSVKREQKLSQQNLASQSRVDEAALAQAREKLGITARELAIKNHEARIKQLEARLAKAAADRDLAAINLERTKIMAPFSGIVNKRFVAIGDRVSVNESILEMYATDVLEIRAQLTTDRLAPITRALANQIKLQGLVLDNPALKVTLDRVAGEVELDEGGVDALFVIEGPKAELRLGQAVKIQLRLPEIQSVIKVPSTAVFERQGTQSIYEVIEQEQATRLKVHEVQLLGVQYLNDKTFFLVQPNTIRPMKIMTTRLPLARDNLKVEIRDPS